MCNGLYVGRTLLPATHRDLMVCMVNSTAEQQTLSSGTCLCNLQPIDVVLKPDVSRVSGSPDDTSAFSTRINATSSDAATLLMEKFPDDLTESQQHQIPAMLNRYNNVFFRGTFDMGQTFLVEHRIDTGISAPSDKGYVDTEPLSWTQSTSKYRS